jgi:hypothetical protein
MIAGWSRLFFGRRNLAQSSVAAAALAGTSIAYAREAQKPDRLAARAAVPLVGWVVCHNIDCLHLSPQFKTRLIIAGHVSTSILTKEAIHVVCSPEHSEGG